MLLGFRPSLALVAISGFGAMLALPIGSGSSQALWQTKTDPDVQGRVFAVRRVIAQFTGPIAIVLAGPLIDNVFQPLMDIGGPLESNIGQLLEVGPGRGAGLLFMVMGIVVLLASLAFWSLPKLRHVQEELPDVEVIEKEDTESEVAEEAAPKDE